ncbi:MAG: DMT family transporter [Alphaproteobacteria bacterium]
MSALATSSLRGILWMLVAMGLIVLSNATTKWISADYSAGQVVFFRSLFVLLFLIPIVWRSGGIATLRITNWRDQGLRSLFHTLTAALIVTSVVLLPLADVEVLLFSSILFIALLSGPVLGERVGWHRMSAVLVGFVGVLIMLRPTPELWQPVAFLAVAAALFSALRDVWARKMRTTENTNAMMMCGETLLLVVSGLTAFTGFSALDWKPLVGDDLFLMALNGLAFGGAQYALILAFRQGEAAAVAPFRYSAAIWAVTFGYLMFGDLPDVFVLVGGSVIIASGLYILHRETRGAAS